MWGLGWYLNSLADESKSFPLIFHKNNTYLLGIGFHNETTTNVLSNRKINGVGWRSQCCFQLLSCGDSCQSHRQYYCPKETFQFSFFYFHRGRDLISRLITIRTAGVGQIVSWFEHLKQNRWCNWKHGVTGSQSAQSIPKEQSCKRMQT